MVSGELVSELVAHSLPIYIDRYVSKLVSVYIINYIMLLKWIPHNDYVIIH